MGPVTATITAVALSVIAAVQVMRLAVWWQRGDAELEDELDEEPRPARRYPAVFAPIACGFATSYAGFTGNCCRHRNHAPPCLTDAAIEHLATHGGVTVVEPLAKPEDVEFGETHG